jgi:hypothetical protein
MQMRIEDLQNNMISWVTLQNNTPRRINRRRDGDVSRGFERTVLPFKQISTGVISGLCCFWKV